MTKKVTKKVTKKAQIKLPSKASDLIDLAVKDIEAVERSKKFKIGMDRVYHGTLIDSTSGRKVCEVCFGGAVLAKSIGCEPTEAGTTKAKNLLDENNSLAKKIFALDSFRVGEVIHGLTQLRGADLSAAVEKKLYSHGIYDFEATEYSKNPLAFKLEMRTLAFKLRQVGL